MMKYIIDTNFILRYLLADNKEHYKKTKTIFDQVRNGQAQVILEQSVFVETIFVLSSFYKTPKDKIIDTMHSLLTYKGINTDSNLLHKTLEIYKNHNIHIVDSVVAAKTALEKANILTFDKKLGNIVKE